MKTITIIKNLFNLDELQEKTKNKAIDKIKDILIDNNFEFCCEDDLQYTLKEKYNLQDYTLNYSLSYSQGDGVCFYSKHNILSYTNMKNKNNLNAFEKFIIDDDKFFTQEEKELIIQYLNEGYGFTIKKSDYHYSHAYTCYIDYEYYYSDDNEENCDKMNSVAQKVCDILFEKVYVEICNELEKLGYSFYEVSDDDIKQYISDNDIYFEENGDLYFYA